MCGVSVGDLHALGMCISAPLVFVLVFAFLFFSCSSADMRFRFLGTKGKKEKRKGRGGGMNTDVPCAAAAGVGARLVCHPLDTIKTVAFTGLSGDRGARNHGFRGSVKFVWEREGIAGFYRGIGVATLGSAPGVALYLTTYTWSSELLQKHRGDLLSAAPSWSLHLLCGLLAEAVSCTFWVPVDVTKERLQSQPPSQAGRYTGSWNALRTIAQYEGVRGLYKGYASTLASFGPYSAVYFAFYEYLKDIFGSYDSFDSFTSVLCAGGLGNLAAAIVTNPLEFVKTRLQVQRAVLRIDGRPATVRGFQFCYAGLFDGLRTVVKKEGLWALWRGVGSRAVFAAPNAALTMTIYNYLRLP